MQVVILCGGTGTRLMPLTKNNPKPMVVANKNPFLLYLVDFFKKNNLKNFLFLVGYKKEKIINYFGDGSKFNIKIKYDYQPETINTAKRIYLSKSLFHKKFIIVYCDNFIVFNLKKYIKKSSLTKCQISFLLKEKNIGNFKIKNNSLVYSVNKNYNSNYVELGFIISNKKYFFSKLNNKNVSLNKYFNKFIDDNKYSFSLSEEKYYSIGDVKRLAETKKYLKKKKVILIDRDGIINKKANKGHYITNCNELIFLKDNIKMMQKLSSIGYSFIIITNQAGLNRNMITNKNYKKINIKIKQYFNSKNISLLDIFHCPHHWDDNCKCRKPKNGMFLSASSKYSFRLDQVVYIGDQISDYNASINSNCFSIIMNSDINLLKKNNNKKLLISSNNQTRVIETINKFYNSHAL